MITPDLLPCQFCGQPKDWIDNQYEGLSPACTNQDCFAYAIPMYFCKGALPTRAEPRWIPVTERLPEVDVPVLVIGENCYNQKVVVVRHLTDFGWYDENDDYLMAFVTHWMPLPEPPKEVE